MRVFIPKVSWVGNWGKYITDAIENQGHEVVNNSMGFRLIPFVHALKLQQITKIRTWDLNFSLKKYNEHVLKECLEFRPDIFLVMNEAKLYPTTIKQIKEKLKCTMVLILADDPWDSVRYVADFPHSLKYFDFIFNSEPAFTVNIKKAAPNAKIYWHLGGFDPNVFFKPSLTSISSDDRKKFECEASFTGSAYSPKAEGGYRSDILSYISDYDLRIWGDDDWPYRFKYLPELKQRFYGDRLSYEDLRKLYFLSRVNINLPAPQILTGFQPRVFEIAATGGFQIADSRKYFKKIFEEDELVTFDTIGELREKLDYFLTHDLERQNYIDILHNKVVNNFTWKHWGKKIMDTIINPEDFDQLT